MNISGLNIKSSDGSHNRPVKEIVKLPKDLMIVICLPGSNFSATFLKCILNTVVWFMENGIKFVISQHESSVVYFVRNLCLGAHVCRGIHQKPFNGEFKYSHILWIDSDSVWDPQQHILPLILRDVDVVGGVYPLANRQSYAVVTNWDKSHYKKHGIFPFLTIKDIERKTDLIEAYYIGFGLTLMKYGVMESLEYPWFKQIETPISKEICDMAGEDVSCCLRLREKGFKIWADPTVRVGHEKRQILV